MPANLINTYEVLKHELLLVSKEAVEKIGKPTVIASTDSIGAKQSKYEINPTQIASSRTTRNDRRKVKA